MHLLHARLIKTNNMVECILLKVRFLEHAKKGRMVILILKTSVVVINLLWNAWRDGRKDSKQ